MDSLPLCFFYGETHFVINILLPTILYQMQLNLARLRYELGSALSVLTDEVNQDTVPPSSPVPPPPKGELKRSLTTRVSTLRYNQARWIAPRLNLTVAEFTRIAFDVVIDNVIQQNPHILIEDFPVSEVVPPHNSQLSLFADDSSLPALVQTAKLKSTKSAKTRLVG